MGTVKVLGWVYVVAYAVVGAAIGLSDAPELIGYLWVPFGMTMLVFLLSAKRDTDWSRATCALIASAIAAAAAGSAVLSVLAWVDEVDLAPDSVVVPAAWVLGGGLTLAVFVLMTARLFKQLRAAARARGLVRLAAEPTAVVVIAAAVSGIVLVATPELPEVFLEGLMAMISLFWCALSAAWLAGAWLVVLRARSRLDPPPIPPARIAR